MSNSKAKPKKRREIRQKIAGFLGCHGHLLLPGLATILTLCSTWVILGPVLNRSGDNIYHMLNQYAIARGVMSGDNPLGPVGMEFGIPLLRFYQCLFCCT